MSQSEEIPSPGRGFQGFAKSRELAACTGKTLGIPGSYKLVLLGQRQDKLVELRLARAGLAIEAPVFFEITLVH